jgi:transposase
VYVPEQADEAIRDLSRAREDAIRAQRAARHQLKALLLRNGIRYGAKSAWTPGHRRWIARLKLPDPVQQIVFQDYVNAVEEATRRVASLSAALEAQAQGWSRAPLVRAYQALRGVQLVNAACLAAELGDLRRFANARELMAFVGLVPSEHSSGESRRQGRITKTGNAHARRALIEAAWHYRLPARVTPIIARRLDGLPKPVTDIAWAAQLRLCARFRRLAARRVLPQKVVVAIARELVGFIWAIGQIAEQPH